MTRSLISAGATIALLCAVTPVSGEALPGNGRESAPAKMEGELGGAGLLLGIVAAAVLVVFVLIGSDDEDQPLSA